MNKKISIATVGNRETLAAAANEAAISSQQHVKGTAQKNRPQTQSGTYRINGYKGKMLGGLLLEGSGMIGSSGKDRNGTAKGSRKRQDESGMTLNELFQRANN